MDRIFDKNEIKKICNELKKILKECRKEMNTMAREAGRAKDAITTVPSYAKAGNVSADANALIRAIESVDFDTLLTKLDDCEDRACSQIPSADKKYAKETAQLKSEVDNIKKVAQRMQEFLIDTPLNIDSKSFEMALKVASIEWNEVMNGSETILDKLLKWIKGVDGICSVFSADPVNLSTGNFIFDRTDLEIKGNSPFIFRRFYNAMNDRIGVLGRDWNHNYEISVEVDGNERILFLEEGKEERFVKTAEGIFIGVYQDTLLMEETEEGYIHRIKEGKAYYFHKNGQLVKQELADGSLILFTHKEGRLSKVSKESGEFFTLSYTQEGYLRSVEDHTGRHVSYCMDGDHLSSVCNSKGQKNYYEYNPEGKIESIRNARDTVVVENFYDEKMRTTLQKFPDGGQMSFEYRDEAGEVILTERNGSQVTYVHDDRYRDIKHIYSDGEEKFVYNRWNQKTMEVDKLGHKIQYAYDEQGNLTRIINALGEQTNIRYGEYGKPLAVSINGELKTKNSYDEKGNIIHKEDGLGNCHEIRYNDRNKPEEVIQPDGSRISLSYDERGNILQVTDAFGAESRYEYDALNRVIKSVDGNGNETLYTYDKEDNLTSITNAEGKKRLYQYNASGLLTELTDFDGNTIKRQYNAINRPSKVTDQLGRETLFTYDAMWNLARVTQPDGAKTTYLYNEHNRLGRIRSANGAVVRYEYDANGNRIKETDEEGNETRLSYDALGRLVCVESPEEVRVSYAYDAQGNLSGVTDGLGNKATFTHDTNGNLIREMGPCGEERVYTYTSMGEVESVTDEAGGKTICVYETGGRLKEIQHPDGNKESYAYDRGGRIVRYTDRTGYELHYTYDSLDRIRKIRGSGGEERCYGYDSLGNVILMTDALGNETRYEYSLTGQLTKVTDALGNETCYRYDVCDRLMEICQYGEIGEKENDPLTGMFEKAEEANGKGHMTRYERDLMGNVTAITDALDRTERYTYDRKGQLLEKVDKEGYLTKYGYTGNGDINSIRYADGREVQLSYNPLRYLNKIEDWLGTTRIKTDPLGRALEVIYPDGKRTGYRYGASGERQSLVYPDGKSVEYSYDEQMRLTSVTDGEDVTAYAYDEKGFLTGKVLPNGIETAYTYDVRGLLAGLTHRDKEGIIDAYTYGYDKNGNRTRTEKSRRDLLDESGSYSYEYDPLGRLSEVTQNGELLRSYAYDAFGNRIRKREGRNKTEYRYNEVNQLIHEKDREIETAYQYDKRGNLTQIHKNGRLTNEYHFGAINRMEQALNHESGQGAFYRYNGLGHRTGRTQGPLQEGGISMIEPGVSKIRPERQIDDIIDLTKQYHNLLERRDGEEIMRFTWSDELLHATGTEGSFYYLQDELGSPLRVIDGTGLEKEKYGYDEFGNILYPVKGIQPFTFTGYQRDETSGTHYAQAREYRPETGRFLSEDIIKGSIAYPFTMNTYSYCWNKPKDLVDLDGELPTVLIGAIVGGVIGGIGSIALDAINGREIDWKKAGKNTVKGAVAGAIIGTGVGAVGALSTAGASTVAVNTAVAATAGASIRAGADVVTSIKDKDMSISTPNRYLTSAASGVMLYHSFRMSKKGAGLGILIQGASDLFAGELTSFEGYAGGAFTSALTLKYLKDPSKLQNLLAAMVGSGVATGFEMLGGVRKFSLMNIIYEMGISAFVTTLANQMAKIKYLNIIFSNDEWTGILDGLRRRFENVEKK